MALVGWVDTVTHAAVLDVDFPDAPADPDVLATYLATAYEQCVEYLPHTRDALTGELVPVVPDPLPDRLVKAQIWQARALYASVVTGPGDQVGVDGMRVTVYPMDWSVRNLLRPRRVGRFA